MFETPEEEKLPGGGGGSRQQQQTRGEGWLCALRSADSSLKERAHVARLSFHHAHVMRIVAARGGQREDEALLVVLS